MAWLYVPASGCSTKGYEQDSSILESNTVPSLTLKGKPLQRRTLSRAWKMARWMKRLSGLTFSHSTAQRGVEKWIASLPDSRANLTPSPVREKDSTTNDGYGRTSLTSFARLVHGFAGWRTSPDLFQQEGLPLACETFPRSGLMRNGECFQQEPLALRTGESDCSSWPTPLVRDEKSADAMESVNYKRKIAAGYTIDLNSTAVNWATPNTLDGLPQKSEAALTKEMTVYRPGRSMPANLRDQVTQMNKWGTPTARDYKDGATTLENTPTKKQLGREVLEFSRHHPTTNDGEPSLTNTHTSRRRLNPAFAAWLMGWPWWWANPTPINCAASEMASYRCRLRQHLCCLLGEQTCFNQAMKKRKRNDRR
jgi:hypothetical protein